MDNFYILDIRTLPDPKTEPNSLFGLPLERREKCLKYKMPDDRRRSLGAGRLIERILNEHGICASLRYLKNGKPEADGIYFNVSHSGDYVIAAAADTPIGCDIEKIQKAPIAVAERYFCPEEIQYIMSHSDKDLAFWQLWTLKESYMKMTGEGMKALSHIRLYTQNPLSLYYKDIRQNAELKHFVHDGHMIAVCKAMASSD